jgi:signal transduction histidine kinase
MLTLAQHRRRVFFVLFGSLSLVALGVTASLYLVYGFQKNSNSLLFYALAIFLVLAALSLAIGRMFSSWYECAYGELKLQEEMVIQESKLAVVGEMVTFIAHQWRQPLNVISSILLRFRADTAKAGLAKESLNFQIDQCEQTLEHLSYTLETFKNFYAPNHTKEFFLFSDTINESLEIMRHLTEGGNISVALRLHGSSSIYGEKGEFIHVLLSIISNACDALKNHGQEKPQITIESYQQDKKIIVEISDNGGGIDPEILAHVFDRFRSTKPAGGGVGVGLYVARLIITRRYNGELTAKNEGDGAKFTIEVPLLDIF